MWCTGSQYFPRICKEDCLSDEIKMCNISVNNFTTLCVTNVLMYHNLDGKPQGTLALASCPPSVRPDSWLLRSARDPPSPSNGVIFLPRKTWSPLGGSEITDFGIHPLPGRRKPTAMEGEDGRTERSGVIWDKRSPIPPPDYKSASIHPTSAIRSSVCTSPGCIWRIKDVANLKLGNIYFPQLRCFS